MAEEKDFEFEKWCTTFKLTTKTVQLLTTEELLEPELLSELTETEINAFDLSLGQKKALKKGVISLQSGNMKNNATSKPVTTTTLQKDKELSSLLSDITEVDNILGGAAAASQDAEWFQPTRNAGKALLIQDFVGSTYTHENDEQCIATTGNTQLKVVSRRAKPDVEKVTLPQWITANARIMYKLIQEDRLDDIKGYLLHTIKFGEYADDHNLAGLLRYDHEYRIKQAQGLLKWGGDSVHLATRFLRPAFKVQEWGDNAQKRQGNVANPPRRGKSRYNRPPRFTDRSGTEICMNYNKEYGCTLANCRFAHVCFIPSCHGDHPEYLHNTLREGKKE